MITQIRKQTFETNSSSSHSFTLGTDDSNLLHNIDVTTSYLYKPETQTIEAIGDEFGWGFETLTSWEERLNYLAAQSYYSNEEIQNKLKEVFKEFTGYTLVFNFSDNFKDKNYSYIDHQSQGITDDIFNSNESIINFIFNNETKVIIDNDNH